MLINTRHAVQGVLTARFGCVETQAYHFPWREWVDLESQRCLHIDLNLLHWCSWFLGLVWKARYADEFFDRMELINDAIVIRFRYWTCICLCMAAAYGSYLTNITKQNERKGKKLKFRAWDSVEHFEFVSVQFCVWIFLVKTRKASSCQ